MTSTIILEPLEQHNGQARGRDVPDLYHFNLEDYEQMIESDVINENSQVELLQGRLYNTMPVSQEHIYTVMEVSERLKEALGKQVKLLVQSPINIHPDSAPEPDIALLKPTPEIYKERKPEANDVLLLIEVSKSTLAFDREIKLPIYAQATIKEVWLINLIAKQLEVYSQPEGNRYRQSMTYDSGSKVAPLAFPEFSIDWWS